MARQCPSWSRWTIAAFAVLGLLVGGGAFSVSRAAAGVEFAFAVGDGVNAYYLPTLSEFVYASAGLYYEWAGDAWVYSPYYTGPWLPLFMTIAVPLPLRYGPPPPVFAFRPYFVWWRARVAPWYRIYHPGWWVRHHGYLVHYRIWRARVIPLYRDRPFYRGAIHPVLRPLGGRMVIVHRKGPLVIRNTGRRHPLPYRRPLPRRRVVVRVRHRHPPR
ncbi:hypothetical protein [Acidithiobacillus sulfuriphilus]|uniref:Uncharacterized protein n=1 Tax=Acidithiobacillus sulfuriphilus TaxID=1867749 RepID=A0ACD5HTC6_9PROT|nr:hypothetical protein [Acidithiobacillus sulfuriphilus]